MANEAAALPWGLPAGNQNNDPEINVNVPESMKLEIGVAKIEVKWILSSDEESDAASDVTKWWPATISRLSDTDSTHDGQGRLAFILRYEPDAEFGYEDVTEHTVTFLNEHEIFDLGEVDLLQWRLAGTDWDGVPSWEDENPDMKDGEAIISMQKVMKRGDMLTELTGSTIREDLARSMQGMPLEEQRIFADRVSTGLTAFGEELRNMITNVTNSEGDVIQLEDVQRMLERLRERTGAEYQ